MPVITPPPLQTSPLPPASTSRQVKPTLQPLPAPNPTLMPEESHEISDTFIKQINRFYQRHPRYAGFAKQHPHLNKALMLTAVVATITLPLWLRSLTKSLFQLAFHRLPKPANWQKGGLWFLGLGAGITASASLAKHFVKPQQTTQPAGQPSLVLAPLLLP